MGPSDAIWHWRSWSTLVQIMACCLTAPSHYLNQCWLIISKVLWHLSEDIIIRRFDDINQQSKIEDYIFKITLRSPKGQWVKISMWYFNSNTSNEIKINSQWHRTIDILFMELENILSIIHQTSILGNFTNKNIISWYLNDNYGNTTQQPSWPMFCNALNSFHWEGKDYHYLCTIL